MKTTARRPFRLLDGMVLVAATAVGFTFFRQHTSPPFTFSTFGGTLEQKVFFWMHYLVPFPATWSLAIFAIALRDRPGGKRRRIPRDAGAVAGCSATVALGLTALIAGTFYMLHILEEVGSIPRIFTHLRKTHGLPPFGNAPMEEIVGASVLGAWTSLAATGRWRSRPTWIDRSGRALGVFWIGLFLLYL